MGKKKTGRLKLIVDTREQKPLEFNEDVFDEVVREGVPVADYWAELDGVQLPLVFERKGMGDLFGTMTKGYQRFKREIERGKEHKLQIVLLIEGSMRDVAAGYKHSKFEGKSMLKKLAMLRVRYDLEWHCFNDRAEMAKFIELHFDAVRRNFSKRGKS